MVQSLMLDFPVSEFEARLKKLVAAMDKEGLDAVILTSDENTFYFSGFRSIVWDSKVSTPGTVIITKDGDMALATSVNGSHTARATSCVEDIRTYGKGGGPTYIDAITSLLREKGLMSGRIGFEFGKGHKMHLNYAMMTDLFTALKDAQRVDAADALWSVRCIKSPLEIQRIRECGRINTEAIQKGFDSLREGMTEMELYGIIMAEYFHNGADRSLTIGLRAGPERYSQGNCPPSDRPIMKGDIVLVDGGPVYKGYYTDIIRECVIGAPTPRQLEMFNIAREACYKGLDAVKPGVPLKHVSDVVDQVMDASKYAELNPIHGWAGHGLGVGVHEYPMITKEDVGEFRPGMVFAIEPYFFEEGVGSLGIEENFVVTETGYELLTPSNSELMVY